MPNFTAKDVQALRKATGAGMMDAKRALEATDGDAEEAAKWLREKGLGGVAKRADREAGEGAVSLAITEESGRSSRSAARRISSRSQPELVRLGRRAGCARSESRVRRLSTSADRGPRQPADDSEGEHLASDGSCGSRLARTSVLGSYLHIQNERGVNGVLVELRNGDRRARARHRHSTSRSRDRSTSAATRFPAADVAEERATVEQIARNEGKPEAALPKIVEGRMNGFFKELCPARAAVRQG